MAGKCLPLVATLLGLVLQVFSSDTVHFDDVADNYEGLQYTTTPYPTQTEAETAPLGCYDCTSYMPSCKRQVTDFGGEIVSRTGCKTKCFLRVGEEQSGALYRGCMDDFLSAQLTLDYIGCKVQEWNGRKSLWCLCDGDLCNGKSLKSLFYYGYGSPKKLDIQSDGKAYIEENPQYLDVHFNEMTKTVDNYNSYYEVEAKIAEDADDDVVEPLGTVSPVENTAEVTDEDVMSYNEADYQIDQPEAYDEQINEHMPFTEDELKDFSQQEPEEHEETQEKYTEGLPSAETSYDEYAYSEEPHKGEPIEVHLPFPVMYPLTPEKHEQYPPALPPSQESHFPGYLSYPQYPLLHTHFKYYGEDENNKHEVIKEDEDTQQEPLNTPEGKSADLPEGAPDGYEYPEYYKYPQKHAPGYPYPYFTIPELQLEPAHYFPYEEVEATEKLKQVEAPKQAALEQALENPEVDIDPELFCPSTGIFTYEEDCSKFLSCLFDPVLGKTRIHIMKCPGGLVFDNIANTCMLPERSNGCKRLPSPPPVPTEPYAELSFEDKAEQIYDNSYDEPEMQHILDS